MHFRVGGRVTDACDALLDERSTVMHFRRAQEGGGMPMVLMLQVFRQESCEYSRCTAFVKNIFCK